MKSGLILLTLVLLFSTSKVKSLKSYRDYKVVSFEIKNEIQLTEIQKLELQPGVSMKKND